MMFIPNETGHSGRSISIYVSEDVRSYIARRDCDFRVCTTCGGPILLSVDVKPPKSTDYEIFVEGHTIYVSMYQIRFLDRIDATMIPQYCDYF